MAENNPNQSPQVGVVGQPQQQAQQVQRGVPGVQQPPVPSAKQTQEIIARQQAELRQQVAESQRRAKELGSKTQPGQTTVSMRLEPTPPQQQVPASVIDQMPPEMQQAVQQQTAQARFTTEPTTSQQPQRQPVQPNQFAQFSEPEEVQKDVIMWHPMRGNGVTIELTDCIIKGVPDRGIGAEQDPQAKVVLALFSEILALRQHIAETAQSPQVPPDLMQRIVRLEQTLFEQRSSLSQQARGIREQIELLQMKGMTPDQILESLQGQASSAEQMVQQGGPVASASHIPADQQAAAQADMIEKATGEAPTE